MARASRRQILLLQRIREEQPCRLGPDLHLDPQLLPQSLNHRRHLQPGPVPRHRDQGQAHGLSPGVSERPFPFPGPTGLLQESPRPFRIIAILFQVRVVGRMTGMDPGVGRRLLAPEDRLVDAGPVDGQEEGPPHPEVVERRMVDLHCDMFQPGHSHVSDPDSGTLLQFPGLLQREPTVGEMDLPGGDGDGQGVEIGNHPHQDPLQAGRRAQIVGRVADQQDMAARDPFPDLEGAVGPRIHADPLVGQETVPVGPSFGTAPLPDGTVFSSARG